MADMSGAEWPDHELPPDPFPVGYVPPPLPPPPAPPRHRYAKRITATAVLMVVFAAVAVVTGGISHAEATRKPTQAELSAAAATGLAQRWQRVSVGTLFPTSIGYSTSLLTQEKATRLGISPATTCAAAVDQTLTALTVRYRCRGAVRASYVDALGGAVYTVGVLAFPTTSEASAFYSRMPASGFPAAGLNTLALTGTASARFDDAARQLANAQKTGPYVVLVVAGYADGRPANATREQRSSVFAPAPQIVAAVVTPLNLPEIVNCQDTAEWTC